MKLFYNGQVSTLVGRLAQRPRPPTWILIIENNIIAVILRIISPTRLGSVLRLLLALSIGLILGMGVAVASSFSSKLMTVAIAAMLLPFMVMMMRELRMVLIAGILVEIIYPIDLYLNHQPQYEEVGAIGGFIVSLTTAMLIALYVLWLIQLLVGKGKLSHCFPYFSVPHFLYFIVVVLSLRVTHNTTLTVFEIGAVGQALLLYTYFASTVREKKEIMFIIVVLIGALLLEGLLMTAARAAGRSIYLGPIEVIMKHTGRVGGTFSHPVPAAGALVLLMAPTMAALMAFQQKHYRILVTSGLFWGFLGVAFTQSRSGMIGLGLSFVLICAMALVRGWITVRVPITAIVLSIPVGIAMAPVLFARFGGDDNGSAESRVYLNELAWRIISDFPVLGAGGNNFAYVMPMYVTPEISNEWLFVAHNRFMLVWAETGTIGLVAFSLMLLMTIYHGLVCWQSKTIDRTLGLLALGLLAGFTSMLLQMQIDVFNNRSLVQLVWLVAGLIAAISRITTAEVPSPVADQSVSTSQHGVPPGRYLQPAGLATNQPLAYVDQPGNQSNGRKV